MNKKIYIIGIGGIGISAIARYYLGKGYRVFGSDSTASQLTETLEKEGCDIIIGVDAERIDESFDCVVYTEAIPAHHSEWVKAKKMGIKTLSYPEALAEIANKKILVSIAGSHGKSTTSSLTSLILKNAPCNVNSVVGTILKEFGGKNAYFSESPYFVIEACEYRRSFLHYRPSVGVVVNIDLDHLDYYKDLPDYISAFESYLNNIVPDGFAVLNGEDKNCKKLLHLRKDIKYIEVYQDYFTFGEEKIHFPEFSLQIPGEHILFDAKIAYVIGHMMGIDDINIIHTLENYSGVWRRMEFIGKTSHDNLLMSDYGHHPNEIAPTLTAIKQKYPHKQLLVVFQPHQYSRTLELLQDFKNCFTSADTLIIPDIYASRDSEEDKQKINSQKLIALIHHPDKHDGAGFENTLKFIEKYDTNHPNQAIILLLGAGNIDDLRFQIEIK